MGRLSVSLALDKGQDPAHPDLLRRYLAADITSKMARALGEALPGNIKSNSQAERDWSKVGTSAG
jgi:hypothetical protein